jgi:hypothetical protein
MSAKLDKATAARLLGMKLSEVRRVIATANGPVIQTHDGTETLVRDPDGVCELVLVNRRVPGFESLLDVEQPDEDDEDEDDGPATDPPAPAGPVRKAAAPRGR